MRNRLLLIIASALALALLVFLVTRGGSAPNSPSSVASTAKTTGTKVSKRRDAKTIEPASVSGRVLAADGTPLGGATVALVAGKGVPNLKAHDAVIVSGTDGSYAYSSLVAGEYTISANAPGFVPRQADVKLQAGQSRRELNLQLSPGGFLMSGTVRDATGGTVAGAVVQAIPVASQTPSGALAGSDGTYNLGLENGHYTVWAYHADYVPHSKLVEVSGRAITVDFQLAPGAVVEGQVKHLGSDEAVPGAIVTYATERSRPFGLWEGTSGAGRSIADSKGKFRITGLSSGALLLSANGENATSSEPTHIALGIAEQRSGIELFVESAHRVNGRIVDAKSGEGVGEMRVSVSGPEEFGSPSGVTSDADGNFEILGVAAGKYRIQVRGKDYIPDYFGTSISVEADTDVGDIALSRGAMVSGRVDPAMEADISVDLLSLTSMTPAAFAQIRSNADGTFEIGPFKPAALRLQAASADGSIGSVAVDVPATGLGDVVIALSPGASIEGTVVDDSGAPVADARVSLRQKQSNKSLSVVVNGRDRMAQSARTSPDGGFLIQGVSAGPHEISVLDTQGQALAWAGASSRDPKTIELGAQEQRTGEVLKVEAQNASITGHVLGPDGAPAPDTWVSARLHRNFELGGIPDEATRAPDSAPPTPDADPENDEAGETRTEVRMVMVQNDEGGGGAPGLDLGRSGELPPVLTDAEGAFVISGLRKGEYDLVAEGMRGAARAFAKQVKSGAEVEIRMEALTRIEGTVTQNGEPATRFTVELSGTGHARKRVRDDKGGFVLHRLDPGPYTLRVRGDEGEAEVQIEVEAGKTTEVEVALESLVRVTGTVVDKEGTPLAGLLALPTPTREDGNLQIDIGDDVEQTNAAGTFELRVAPGSYLLLVMKMGAGPMATIPFEAKEGADLDLGTITGTPGTGMPPGGPEGGEGEGEGGEQE